MNTIDHSIAALPDFVTTLMRQNANLFPEDSFIAFFSNKHDRPEWIQNQDYVDILIVIRGSARIQFHERSDSSKDQDFILSSSAVCIVTPGMPYRTITKKDTVMFHILYKKEDFKIGLSSMISCNNTMLSFLTRAMYKENEPTYIGFFFNLNEEIIYILSSMLQTQKEAKPFYLNIIYYMMGILFSLTERERTGPLLLPPSQKYNLHEYEIIYAYMSDCYATTSVKEIADTFHLSQSYLTKLFKKHTNQTVSEILQKIRLQTACSFLNHSKLSVQEISEMVGYGDVTHFIRIFKKTYGATPLQYRKRKTDSGIIP